MALEYPFEMPATLFQSIGMPPNTQIDAETLLAFGKALMIVAGADDRLSVWERGWMTAYMASYNAPPSVTEALDDFDYKTADLDDYLKPLLAGRYSRWVRRSLLQGAIRMAQADDVVDEEYQAILRLGARLGMGADVVNEVRSLVQIFDSVTGTNAVLLSIAQKEDAEDILRRRGELPQPDAWDEDAADSYITLPEDEALEHGQETFAKALLFVAGADGDVSVDEMSYFEAYMRNWGASDDKVALMKAFDYRGVTAEEIVQGANSLQWGLKALTTVAIRTAGADGLKPAEEQALLELYRLSGHNAMMYYASRGLEAVRALALARLNTIFSAYL